VSEAVAVDRWSGTGMALSAVVDSLSDLRDQSDAHQSSARTSVMTMVAVAPSDEQAYGATSTLRALAGHHPARIVLLRPDPDSVAYLSARATLYALDTEFHRVNFEELVLEVGGQAAKHLDSLVEAFTLSDLPVAVWYVNSIPDPSDRLLELATALVVDSRDAPDPGQLRSLLQLARRRTLVDLSWSRLRPWRELMSGLFDPPQFRPWVDDIERVEVHGKNGPRRLLGGWIAAQTGVSSRRVSLTDERHVSVRLTCGKDSSQASFSVERVEGQRVVAAEAILPDGSSLRATASLPEDPLATSLAAALTNLRPDPIWERALSAATVLDS
jgi:hypothetical protein